MFVLYQCRVHVWHICISGVLHLQLTWKERNFTVAFSSNEIELEFNSRILRLFWCCYAEEKSTHELLLTWASHSGIYRKRKQIWVFFLFFHLMFSFHPLDGICPEMKAADVVIRIHNFDTCKNEIGLTRKPDSKARHM